MPFRPPHRRVEHGDEEKDEHEAGSDDDLPSLYESSDRESTADVDDYEDEARRYIRYQLSAAPEAQFHRAPAISASTFYANSRRRAVDPAVHPQFRSKTVCELFCGHCDAMLCRRGMSAILLGDTTVNLYSTDARPQAVELVGAPYTTSSCNCLIHDAACHLCGNVIAYNVTKPCEKCLRATHNGHLWIFATEGIRARERLDSTGMRLLRWSHLPPVDQDGAQSGDGSGTQAQNGSVRAKGRRKAADLFVNR
ncbi:FAM72 protein-domain-containing protein [Hyaloraphidium curvatum]|nr:FAM72 protein-domain-containing protein [Hyaloraphidium curvatum]